MVHDAYSSQCCYRGRAVVWTVEQSSQAPEVLLLCQAELNEDVTSGSTTEWVPAVGKLKDVLAMSRVQRISIHR